MKFQRWTEDENGNKVLHLKDFEWELYRYLEKEAKADSTRWITKQEIMENIPAFKNGVTAHDECALVNSSITWLFEALSRDMISHVVCYESNKCKLAARGTEDAERECNRHMRKALIEFKRYWIVLGAIKLDGQGRMIDKRGNVISEESLAKKFNEATV